MTLIDKAEALAAVDANTPTPAGGPFSHTNSMRVIAADIRRAIDALPARGVVEKPDRDTFDAMCAMRNSINEHVPMPSLESDLLQGPENSVFCATVAEAVINEVTRLRSMASGARVKRLEWHNFDAWTHWAEGACGTYHVEERNGYWQVELRVGGLVHGVTQTDDTTPADLDAAKSAAQADYEARILSALAPTDAAHESIRCAECDCANGGDECTWIKTTTDAAQAQEAQMKADGERAAELMIQHMRCAEAAETALAAERAKTAKLVEALTNLPAVYAHQINTGVREVYDPLQRFYTMESVLAAITEAGQ